MARYSEAPGCGEGDAVRERLLAALVPGLPRWTATTPSHSRGYPGYPSSRAPGTSIWVWHAWTGPDACTNGP